MLADFGWSDLGTWTSLHELTPKDTDGNAVAKCQAMLYNAKNNMIALPEGDLSAKKTKKHASANTSKMPKKNTPTNTSNPPNP